MNSNSFFLKLIVWIGFVVLSNAANVAFAPGVSQNKTIRENIHLGLIRRKLENAISQFRGNHSSKDGVTQTTPAPEEPPEPQPFESALFFSTQYGKNILKFELSDKKVRLSDNDITRVNLWVHVWKKERKKKRTRNLKNRRRGKQIKIRVYNIREESQKGGKKIAELITRIKETKWYKISLPISNLQNSSNISNDTVLLRVECKRCNRKTKLVLPETMKCRKRKKRRKNKKKRNKKANSMYRDCVTMRANTIQRKPFIVLEKRRKDVMRSRRSLVEECEAIPAGTTYTGKCCKLQSVVDFCDLGLDDRIVIPSGYTTGSCIGRCPRPRHNGRRGQPEGRQERGRSPTNRRPKCKPAETSSLVVWLFNENHDLVQAQITGLVVNSCACR